MIEVLEKR
jgi:hypothetical protein